jgi:hypothetical protein
MLRRLRRKTKRQMQHEIAKTAVCVNFAAVAGLTAAIVGYSILISKLKA